MGSTWESSGRLVPIAVSDEAGGAETMLNAGVLIESATRRFYFCEGLGIPYSLSMVTNGTLIDRRTIERLAAVGLNMIRVSIAGPGTDSRRAQAF